MKIQAHKQKAEPLKTIHGIKHGRVHFCYVIGLSFIQIWTDTKTDWPEMPEYFRVCFSIEALDVGRDEKTEKTVLKAIKKKVAEQRKTGTGAKLAALKEMSRSQRKKTRQEEFLPFE